MKILLCKQDIAMIIYFIKFFVLQNNFLTLLTKFRQIIQFSKKYAVCTTLSDFLDPCKRSPIYIGIWSFFMHGECFFNQVLSPIYCVVVKETDKTDQQKYQSCFDENLFTMRKNPTVKDGMFFEANNFVSQDMKIFP